jgi:hypothetical protein
MVSSAAEAVKGINEKSPKAANTAMLLNGFRYSIGLIID